MPSTRRPGAVSLVIFALAVAAVVAGFAGTVLLLFVPGGPALLDEHFAAVRIVTYALWAAGVAGMIGAPLTIAREVGARVRWSPLAALDGARVAQALRVALIAHGAVLAYSPLGALLGWRYSWPVFVGHTLVSAVVVAVATMVALLEVSAWRRELDAGPSPSRVSHCEPAGF